MTANGVRRAPAATSFLLYALFTLSGVAGLIYESIWSHYLKLFLGHAAYAQTLVLVIFMGGMAAGAWLAGDLSRRIRQPLYWYAGLEVLLGVAGLSFDGLFRGAQAWLFDSVIPTLTSPLAVDLVKWTCSGLLILPQSILLGATFPLMSDGLVRLRPMGAGSALGWLYFSNSLGASFGVLLSGFVLIGLVGLPGTLLTAGMINFLLALLVFMLARRIDPAAAVAPRPREIGIAPVLLLVTAFVTGMASFMYEIGWIRMLSLVLGSTTHSFELMLSVFILGLACGSFWIRNRIDGADNPLRLLGLVQVAMAAVALFTVPLYMQSFQGMAAFWHAVQSNDGGYALFTGFSYLLCVLLMLPATFCAGMTLPLMTAILLRSGYGEAGIGRIYAANTLGAIAGILAAVHLVMPLMGLRQVVIVGALLDLGLGLWLLSRAPGRASGFARVMLAGTAILSLLAALTTRFDPAVTGSGAYRVGKSRTDGEIIFHQDGKTATVDVSLSEDGTLSIATNGKIDAGVNPAKWVGADDYTMTMLALLPLAMLPEARTAAVIGMGSGTSTHMLLHNPRLTQVDTIEIEPAMLEGARHFGEATAQAYTDPRSHLRVEDAKSYFARAGQRYDLILSEPSNPWVSGIASLFSLEFYAQAKRYLADDGLFVQWLHMYEISPELMATVLNALGDSFEDYAVYANNGDDIMIFAKTHGRLPAFQDWIFANPAMREPLKKLALHNVAGFEVRKLGEKSTLQPYFRALSPLSNSDYFPVLDQGAARQRFLIGDARGLLQIHPYSRRLEGRDAVLSADIGPPRFYQPVPGAILVARAMARQLLGEPASADGLGSTQTAATLFLRHELDRCTATPEVLADTLRGFTLATANQLSPELARSVVNRLRSGRCSKTWNTEVQHWLDLYEGISLSRPALTRKAAMALLQGLDRDREGAQFVVAEWLTADLLEGDVKTAARSLDQVHGLPDNPPLTYLRAQIRQRNAQ